MYEISIKDNASAGIRAEIEEFPRTAASVLRSVANELRGRYAQYAKQGPLGPYSPLTVALRKKYKGGYGEWIARFTRYYVNAQTLTAKIGLLSSADVAGGGGRFEPISTSFAMSAKRHAEGYVLDINTKRVRALAAILTHKYGKQDWISEILPKAGKHQVKPRPIAGPVLAANRQWAVESFIRLFKIKRMGARYSSNWAKGK